MSAQSSLVFERRDQIAYLTINRPHVLNAMDSVAHLELSEALDACAGDDGVRVVVLTGTGNRAFSVGRDLKELSDTEAASAAAARWERTTRLTDRHDYPKPIIARVNGYALGGGFELALACDIIVASENATFALPEVRRGLIPFAGGVHRLPRHIPMKTAMGYLLSGRSMSAQRAYNLGLINEVVPELLLDEAVASWSRDLVAGAPLSIRSIKQCVALGAASALPDAMAASYPAEDDRINSDDAVEGPLAFVQKRKPHWTGR